MRRRPDSSTRSATRSHGSQPSCQRPPFPSPIAPLVARYLERQRWRAQEGTDLDVRDDPHGRFSVVCDRSGEPIASPLNRHLIVLPVATLAAAERTLAGHMGAIEALGFTGPSARTREAAALAAACAASRLCPLDRMQSPPFAWRQSGHARLACFATADDCGASDDPARAAR